MAWNGGINGLQSLAPYMLGRQPAVALDREVADVRNVSAGGVLTLQWGRSQDGDDLPSAYMIFASGVYGQKPAFSADHYPILWICHDTPTSAGTIEEFSFSEDFLTEYAAGTVFGVKADGVSTYAAGDVGDYVYMTDKASYYYCHRFRGGKVMWIPVRIAEADGTATIDGILCDIYQCQISVDDLHDISGHNDGISDYRGGGFFGLCWANNGRHESAEPDASAWDAVFYVPLPEPMLHDTHVQRTELNSRVAGERAIFEDEFLTASQVEAGVGITLKWRNSSGAAEGYTTAAEKAYNLIFETSGSIALGLGTNDVDAIDLETGEATAHDNFVSLVATELVFSDEQDWDYDTAGDRTGTVSTGLEWGQDSLPVSFRAVELPEGQINISARVKHNGVYVSYDDLDDVTNLAPGPNGTTSHFQFRDSETLHWTISEEVFDGPTGFRPGISIIGEVQASGGYSWFALDQHNNSEEILAFNIIRFLGINGVDITIDRQPTGVVELSVDRPLTIQENGVAVGGEAVTEINFDSNGATAGTNTVEVYFDVDDVSSANRRVRAYSKPSATTSPSHIKTQWWYDLGVRNNGLRFGLDDAENGLHRSFNACPAGHYNNVGVLATNYELVMRSGSAIDVGTLTAPLYQRRPDQWVGKTIKVSTTGVYDINTTIRGVHDAANYAKALGLDGHRMEINLFLVIGRGGVIRNYQYLDVYQWAQFETEAILALVPNRFQRQESAGHASNIPWSVQGSGTVALAADDEVWFFMRMNGVGPLARYVYVGYQAFDMHMLAEGVPTVNVMPHELSNVNAAGDFAKFDYLNW